MTAKRNHGFGNSSKIVALAKNKSTIRICEKGHKYYKTSDCSTCPICEKNKKPKSGFLSELAAPARRALEKKGITSLRKLADFSKSEILSLHGMGKTTIPKLNIALKKEGLRFRGPAK